MSGHAQGRRPPTPPASRELDSLVARWSPRRTRIERRSKSEIDILDCAERLLGEVPLGNLEVKQIIAGAGISRTTFYQYFTSKFDVVAALVGRTLAEMVDATREGFRQGDVAPEVRLHQALRAGCMVWWKHRNVFNSGVEGWSADPELGRLWVALYEGWATRLTEMFVLDAERGVVMLTGDLKPLVTALTWSTERVLYVATSGASAGVPDVATATDALYRMWSASLYAPDIVAAQYVTTEGPSPTAREPA